MLDTRALIRALQERGLAPGRVTRNARGRQPMPDGVIATSFADAAGATFFLVLADDEMQLVCWGSRGVADDFVGEEIADLETKICRADDDNVSALQRLFPFTNPQPLATRHLSVGLHDTVADTTPGALRAMEDHVAVPAYTHALDPAADAASQWRTAIANASWAVFAAGWTTGFTVNAAGLTRLEDVASALDAGIPTLTLECGTLLSQDLLAGDEAAALQRVQRARVTEFAVLRQRFLERDHVVSGANGETFAIRYTASELARLLEGFQPAIDFATQAHELYLHDQPVTLAVSLAQAPRPTTVAAHHFFARQLLAGEVQFDSLLPHLSADRACLAQHAALTRHLRYRLGATLRTPDDAVIAQLADATEGGLHLDLPALGEDAARELLAVRRPESADPTDRPQLTAVAQRERGAFAAATARHVARYLRAAARDASRTSVGQP